MRSGTSKDAFEVELDGDGDLTDQILRARRIRDAKELEDQRAAIRRGDRTAVPADVRKHRALVAVCPHAKVVFVGCIGRGLMCAYCGQLHEHEAMSVLRMGDAGGDDQHWIGTQFNELET